MVLANSRNLAKLCFNKNPILYTAIRNHWNKDFKPAPFPLTQEERNAAAKKYGILPEDYEVYPNDGIGYGDYPKLERISGEGKDPHYPYDFPELKRNFNEPLHVDFDMIGEDRYDVSYRYRKPMWRIWCEFLGVIGGSAIIFLMSQHVKMFHGLIPKQYPNQGKTHYTFDLQE